MKPGVYPDLPMAEYLKIPAVGAGVICTLLERCPAAAWYVSHLNPHRAPDPVEESDNGELAHALVLEGDDSRCCVIDPAEHTTEKGEPSKGWTSKAMKEARDRARTAGKIPVLPKQWEQVKAMADAVRKFIDSLRLPEPVVWHAFQDGEGHSEMTGVWEENGVLCRMRSDRISAANNLDINLKFVTRGANPDTFARHGLLSMGYATAGGWYRRGMRKVYGTDATCLWIICEQDPPHLCSIVGLDPQFQAWADRRAARGLRQWRTCVESGVWPGYPSRIAYAELPPWEAAKMEEEEIASPWGGGELDYEKLAGR